MEKIDFANTGFLTSRVGFGCARLMPGAGPNAGCALVESALALGIRHFDTAPSYGLGKSEGVLGSALRGRRNLVTIVSKVGIPRPSSPNLMSLSRSLIKPLSDRIPHLRNVLLRGLQLASHNSPLTIGEIRNSIAETFRSLDTDYLDGILLHEPREPASEDAELLLTDLVNRRRVGAIGVGTSRVARDVPLFGTVMQSVWFPGYSEPTNRFSIIHGFFRGGLSALERAAERNLNLSKLSLQACCDLEDKRTWPSLLLTVALARNKKSIVLISSKSEERLCRAVNGIDWGAVRGECPQMLEVIGNILHENWL